MRLANRDHREHTVDAAFNRGYGVMLRQRRLRRTVGAVLVIAGALLMWLAPEAAFVPLSETGIVLLVAGIALELIGIRLERHSGHGS